MLLIPERQALFLHIPKTGGQTIEALLGVAHQRHHHSPRGLPPDWPRWFRFTFVRHPYSRFVSTCNFNLAMARRHRERYRRQPEPDPLVGLRLWLLERQPPLGAVVQRLAGERQLLRLCHFRPQVRSLRLVQPQFVGRFERFSDDVNTVLRLLGYGQRLAEPLPHLNSSPPDYSLEQLDRWERRQLAELYRGDFQQLGYRRGQEGRRKG